MAAAKILGLARLLAIGVLAMLILLSRPGAQPLPPPPDQVAILIPTFRGEQPIGDIVRTVLVLQLWRTLRVAPTPNPKRLNFGRGMVWWDNGTPVSVADLHHRINELQAQLGLWGVASEFGDDIVVQAQLAVPDGPDRRMRRHEEWRLTLRGETIELGLHRTMFDLPPLVLPYELVRHHTSVGVLRLCPERRLPCEGPPVQAAMRAFRHDGQWARVVTSEGEGWVHLGTLGGLSDDVTNFAGGLIRYMRGDFAGAAELLSTFIASPRVRPRFRYDALLLRALARIRNTPSEGPLVEAALADVDAAAEIGGETAATLQVRVMIHLSVAAGPPGGAASRAEKLASTLLNQGRSLLRPDDPWLQRIEAMLRP
jgi:hypothetical protein